jgi:filamentous hemagglutinin
MVQSQPNGRWKRQLMTWQLAHVNLKHGGHFVVVAGVTTRGGQAVVAVRDPGTGLQYFVPRAEFESKFSKQVVYMGKK